MLKLIARLHLYFCVFLVSAYEYITVPHKYEHGGRVKAYVKKGHIAAARIQCMWRGIVARVRSDKMWLNRCVVPIQTIVRRFLAKQRTANGRDELDAAATIIQSAFRCWVARRTVGNLYIDREFNYRSLELLFTVPFHNLYPPSESFN